MPAITLKCPAIIYLICIISIPAFCQETGGTAGEKLKIRGSVNTDKFNELEPSVTADGQTLIFISDKTGSLKLYMSKLDKDGNWAVPHSLDQINYSSDSSEQFDGASISYDGNSLYFSANSKKSNGNNDIFISERDGKNWSKPVSLGPAINTQDYEGSPSISADGKSLYFTRIKKDFKDKDFNETCYFICRSIRKSDSSWTTPEALPYPVNYQCDKSPRILADNKTLIFSSYRPGTMGGYDFYQSQVDVNGEWSAPVPLSFVNTPRSDSYAAVPGSGEKLYYSLNGDIWSVEIPENMRPNKCLVLDGTVWDVSTKNFLPVNISVQNALTAETVFSVTNNESDGSYSLVLDDGNYYNVEFSKPGYSTAAFSFDLRSVDHSDQFNQEVSLNPSVQLSLRIVDKDLYIPLPADIKVMNEATGSQVTSMKNDVDNPWSIINLKVGSTYKVNLELSHYEPKSVTFDLTKPILFDKLESRVDLSPVYVKLPVNITDYYNGRTINGKVLITNLKQPEEDFEINANEVANLRTGDQYHIQAITENGYFFTYTDLDVSENGIKIRNAENPDLISLSDNSIDIKLIPVVPNSVIKLDKVRFDPLSGNLTGNSYKQLDMIVAVMKANPTVRIEISDKYTNGTPLFSQGLAEKRSRSIADYLIAGNISGKRILYRGSGNIGEIQAADIGNSNKAELKVLEVLK